MSDTDQVPPELVLQLIQDRRDALKKDWRSCGVAMSFLPTDIAAALLQDHGKFVTLGEIADKTDGELVRSANIGARSRNIIREYIRVLDGGQRDPD